MVKGIIFDMDGVLIDSVGLHMKAWHQIFEKYKISFNDEDFDLINGTTVSDGLNILIRKYGLNLDADKLAAEKTKMVIKVFDCELTVNSQVIGIVKSIKEGHMISLASSSPRELIDIFLRESGLTDDFNFVISGEDVVKSKPDPEIFLRCAEKMGIKPMDCIVVEDSIAGLRAAVLAGMKTIAICGSHDRKQLAADLVLDSILDLECGKVDSL